MCTLWSLAVAKTSCNKQTKSRASFQTMLFLVTMLNLRHNRYYFSHRFKIWILKCWSWTVDTSTFSPIYISDGKFGFLKKPNPHFQVFPDPLKILEIGIFKVSLPSLFIKWWVHVEWRWRVNLLSNCQKKKRLHYNLGNNSASVRKFCL